jgi:hypothetical protein
MITTRSIDIFLKGVKNRNMTKQKAMVYRQPKKISVPKVKPLRLKSVKVGKVKNYSIKQPKVSKIKIPKFK